VRNELRIAHKGEQQNSPVYRVTQVEVDSEFPHIQKPEPADAIEDCDAQGRPQANDGPAQIYGTALDSKVAPADEQRQEKDKGDQRLLVVQPLDEVEENRSTG